MEIHVGQFTLQALLKSVEIIADAIVRRADAIIEDAVVHRILSAIRARMEVAVPLVPEGPNRDAARAAFMDALLAASVARPSADPPSRD